MLEVDNHITLAPAIRSEPLPASGVLGGGDANQPHARVDDLPCARTTMTSSAHLPHWLSLRLLWHWMVPVGNISLLNLSHGSTNYTNRPFAGSTSRVLSHEQSECVQR